MRTALRATLLAAAVGLSALSPSPALADEAERAYAEASEAEARLDFAKALEGYRRAVELRPSAPFAARARIRAADLADHAEGGFAPLARLERVRRQPGLASDPAELSALEREAEGFPPGPVRAEARLLVAEAFLRRLRQPSRAIGPSLALLDDPAAEPALRAQALSIAVEALEQVGDHERARAVAARGRALSPRVAQRLETADRRERLRRGSGAVAIALGVADLAALAFLLRQGRLGEAARRVALAPVSALVSLSLAAGGALLAWVYDPSVTVRPFLLLGLGTFACDRSAALWREAAGGGRLASVLSAVAGLIGLAALALLSLLLSDPAFIESFGL